MEIQNFNKSKELNNHKDTNQNNGRKKSVLFFAFICLAFVTAISAFLFFILNPIKNLQKINTDKLPAPEEKTKSEKIISIPGWKTYENKGYGFSFQYPKGFSLLAQDPYLETAALGTEVRNLVAINNLQLIIEGDTLYSFLKVTTKELQEINEKKSMRYSPVYSLQQWKDEKNYIDTYPKGTLCDFNREGAIDPFMQNNCRIIEINNKKFMDRILPIPNGGDNTARMFTFYHGGDMRLDFVVFSKVFPEGKVLGAREFDNFSDDSGFKIGEKIISTFGFSSPDMEWVESGNRMIQKPNPYDSAPANAFDIEHKFLDFNGDGHDEYIIYYKEKIKLYGLEKEKYRFKVYRWDNTQWVQDHEDEGTEGIMHIDSDEFWKTTDIDNDGISEALITKRQAGTGNYRNKYFLKWNGEKISEVFFPNDAVEKAREFLKPGETLGAVNFGMDKGVVPVCIPGDTFCEFRQSATNALANIEFDIVYKNGKLEAVNFQRKNFIKKDADGEKISVSEKITLEEIQPDYIKKNLLRYDTGLENYYEAIGNYPILWEGEDHISSATALTEKGWEYTETLEGKNIYYDVRLPAGEKRPYESGIYFYQPTRDGKSYRIEVIVQEDYTRPEFQYCMARLDPLQDTEYFRGACNQIKTQVKTQ